MSRNHHDFPALHLHEVLDVTDSLVASDVIADSERTRLLETYMRSGRLPEVPRTLGYLALGEGDGPEAA